MSLTPGALQVLKGTNGALITPINAAVTNVIFFAHRRHA